MPSAAPSTSEPMDLPSPPAAASAQGAPQGAGESAAIGASLAETAAKLRHPEKAERAPTPPQRKPPWLRVKAPVSREYHETRELMRRLKLHTVCEEAACPNIGECWSQKHATVMILGSVCTRACAFCNVATGRPDQ